VFGSSGAQGEPAVEGPFVAIARETLEGLWRRAREHMPRT
jgi:hypothetical protein